MLQYLKIKNLALLDEVTLELDAGFTAVTGETGAGKSVLLGALGLLSGARTDKTMIRQGTDQLEVEAALYFEDSTEMDALLETAGLPCCEDGVLLLQRSIHRKKMPRVQINGSMATLSQLQGLGESWIDFHGPGEPQKLFQERRQLEMLDLYAGNADLLTSYQDGYATWRAAHREIVDLEKGERLDEDEIEFVRKQINKIDSVDVSEESIEALERDYTRMSSGQDLVTLAADCSEGLSGDQGLCEQLNMIVGHYESLVTLDAESEPLLERARSLLIEMQDLGEETGRLASDFEFDAEAVEATTERMNLWQEVRRKYGGSVEAVIAKREELAQKLAVQGDIEGTLKAKRNAAAKQEAALRKVAAKLRKAREKAAKILADKAALLLQALGFKKARLEIEMIPEAELQEFGDSRCGFLFSPNAGQDLLPLNKIASSGETARVMLALKTVLAEADATPLLVFDEVDANVGGEVGRAVGAELARLSGRHQVLCVTHLPQVASLAQNHFVVTKSQDEDSTVVSIGPIHDSRDTRLNELARMLGDRHSESARAHAAELLV
ncbi:MULTISPECIES: DNA repair protein RecN [unclassified Lentimonas]|uniref:DNA repair protein RecN n=1 Tax=unclassified Lentimonas TaxID=2630993 RepID=UPI00132A3E32|nr:MULTISPECIES: DNA repair protein RecN [unclassified Lentimonas]CAA6680148.1 DNA repair protein RecN [Lentimonas sp. CC4]CAA6685584.1 DNA repair protein RecN [Lentimonas sp. CC6]CAA6689671.1 DNA repair protein RecN [Lentimonas sp. CC19]CAA6692697.1 DNA repair protein RecN [Lentimonas sp. CC10]CAA7069260.1 DNA repair protein RecN [Lentimonas sp. CC11]